MTKAHSTDDVSSSGPRRLDEESFEMPFSVGDVVGGKYEVTGLLGVGGVGFVVAATHLELGEKVALKFLQPDMLDNPQVVGRFAREALASVKIKNEHVARVHDVGNLPDGVPFIVIEHLEGHNLDDVLREQGPLPIRRAIEYVMQACEALADAHACGVVHRDVKPENLFLARLSQGIETIKVLDFGISKVALTGSAVEPTIPLVKTMLPVGSPLYMSPEQVRASTDIDWRTDIWSIGCVLYELLSGRAAFDAPSITEVSARILEQEPTPLRSLRPDTPPELEAIVNRCLEKDPNQRFGNVAELAVALYQFGPRRTRISAERCCLLLNVAEHAFSDFELPSMAGAIPQRAVPVSGHILSTSDCATLSLPGKASRGRARPATTKLLWGGIAAAVLLAVAAVLTRISSAPTPTAASVRPPAESSTAASVRPPAESPTVTARSNDTASARPPSQQPEPSSPPATAADVVAADAKAPVRAATPARAPGPLRSPRPRQADAARPTTTNSPDPDPGF